MTRFHDSGFVKNGVVQWIMSLCRLTLIGSPRDDRCLHRPLTRHKTPEHNTKENKYRVRATAVLRIIEHANILLTWEGVGESPPALGPHVERFPRTRALERVSRITVPSRFYGRLSKIFTALDPLFRPTAELAFKTSATGAATAVPR